MNKKRNKKKKTVKKTTAQTPRFRSPLMDKIGLNKSPAPMSHYDNERKAFYQSVKEKNYPQALKHAENALAVLPKSGKGPAVFLSDVASCYVYVNNLNKAIETAKHSISLDPKLLNNYDVLSHAYGMLQDSAATKRYGKQALTLRDNLFGKSLKPMDYHLQPPAPSEHTKQRNIISFSLFGQLPRYCETAVLNVKAAKIHYPHWSCRFYVDDSVPKHVIDRLKDARAEVVQVNTEQKKLVGTLWRFLALDDEIDRVIFRDVDALICEAEARAVSEWVDSQKQFHVMRDRYTHTEIILAGLWGAVVGSLTREQSMLMQMQAFMNRQNVNTHFADQYFLREQVWSRVKQSLYQHDSQFGFEVEGGIVADFPIEDRGTVGHIGSDVATTSFYAQVNQPDGTAVRWRLVYKADPTKLYCEYTSVTKGGRITVFIARPIIKLINDAILEIRLVNT